MRGRSAAQLMGSRLSDSLKSDVEFYCVCRVITDKSPRLALARR